MILPVSMRQSTAGAVHIDKYILARLPEKGKMIMNKREEIMSLISDINNEKFLDFICRLIVSFKESWGF